VVSLVVLRPDTERVETLGRAVALMNAFIVEVSGVCWMGDGRREAVDSSCV
jgi:hypothetical protein